MCHRDSQFRASVECPARPAEMHDCMLSLFKLCSRVEAVLRVNLVHLSHRRTRESSKRPGASSVEREKEREKSGLGWTGRRSSPGYKTVSWHILTPHTLSPLLASSRRASCFFLFALIGSVKSPSSLPLCLLCSFLQHRLSHHHDAHSTREAATSGPARRCCVGYPQLDGPAQREVASRASRQGSR
jgi:hypothetical protein